MVVIVSLMFAIGTILSVMNSMGGGVPVEPSSTMLVMGVGGFGPYLQNLGSAMLIVKVSSPGGASMAFWHQIDPNIPYFLNVSAPLPNSFISETNLTLRTLAAAYYTSSVNVQVQNGAALEFSAACPNGISASCLSGSLQSLKPWRRFIVVKADATDYGPMGVPATVLSTPFGLYGSNVFAQPGSGQRVEVLNGTYEIQAPQNYTFNQHKGWLGALSYAIVSGANGIVNETTADGLLCVGGVYCAVNITTDAISTSVTFWYKINFAEYLQLGANMDRFSSVTPWGNNTMMYVPPNTQITFTANTENYFSNTTTTYNEYNATTGKFLLTNTTKSSEDVLLWRPVWTVPENMTPVAGCGNGETVCTVTTPGPDLVSPLIVSAEYCSFPGNTTYFWCTHTKPYTESFKFIANDVYYNVTSVTALSPVNATKIAEGMASFIDQYGPINLGNYGDIQVSINNGTFNMIPPQSFAYTEMVSTGEIPQTYYQPGYKIKINATTAEPPVNVMFQTPTLESYQLSIIYRSGMYEAVVNGTAQDIMGNKTIAGTVGLSFGNATWPGVMLVHGIFGGATAIVGGFGNGGYIDMAPSTVVYVRLYNGTVLHVRTTLYSFVHLETLWF
jgi:hypothetical protein